MNREEKAPVRRPKTGLIAQRPRARRAVLASLLAAFAARGAAAAEFNVVAASFTVDNQVNVASVTYFAGQATTPGNPATATQLTTPGGLYFDGTRYRVWDSPSSAWVSLATGTSAGLLPWSELTSFPLSCPGGQFVQGVGQALTCSASGTLSGGTAGYYGKWTGSAALGLGVLFDNGGTGVTVVNGSTLTVTGSAFSVGASTLVVIGGSVGIGTTTPAAKLEVAGAIQAKNIALGVTPTTTGTWSTLPGSLGNATDGNTATVTTAGTTTQTAVGLSNINIDLGAVYRGIIYVLGGAWASGGATSTTVLSYSQDAAFTNSGYNSWTNTCTTECPFYFAMPFYGRYIAVSCYTSNAANPDNCVVYDLTATLYQ